MVRLFVGAIAVAAAAFVSAPVGAEEEKSDTEVARAVVAALQAKSGTGELKGFNINVSVSHGDLWLKGDVASREQQKMVLDIARHLPGVFQVVNDLKVIPPEEKPQPVKRPPPDEKPRPIAELPLGEMLQPVKKPRPDKEPTRFVPPDLATIGKPVAMPASATAVPPVIPASNWQPRGRRIADQIVNSIRSKRDSGQVQGFDLVVHVRFGSTVYLQGEVDSNETRATLLKTIRRHPEITDVHDLMKLADRETTLPDKVIPYASNEPSYKSRQRVSWDDGWWESDFKSKKHR